MLYENEGVHTLEGGVVRRKRRLSRRPDTADRAGLALLSEIRLGDRRARRGSYWRGFRQEKALLKRVLSDPGPLRLFRPRHPPARP